MILKPAQFKKTVTAAGTIEQLTTAQIRVPMVIIQALAANTGKVHIGNKSVLSSTYTAMASLGAGNSVTLSAAEYGSAGSMWDLSKFWIDAAVSGEGVTVGFAERDIEYEQ